MDGLPLGPPPQVAVIKGKPSRTTGADKSPDLDSGPGPSLSPQAGLVSGKVPGKL